MCCQGLAMQRFLHAMAAREPTQQVDFEFVLVAGHFLMRDENLFTFFEGRSLKPPDHHGEPACPSPGPPLMDQSHRHIPSMLLGASKALLESVSACFPVLGSPVEQQSESLRALPPDPVHALSESGPGSSQPPLPRLQACTILDHAFSAVWCTKRRGRRARGNDAGTAAQRPGCRQPQDTAVQIMALFWFGPSGLTMWPGWLGLLPASPPPQRAFRSPAAHPLHTHLAVITSRCLPACTLSVTPTPLEFLQGPNATRPAEPASCAPNPTPTALKPTP